MALWMWRARRLILGIDLQDGRAGNDILVVELGSRFGEHNVDLANGADGDGVDLVVLVAGGDADFDWELEVASVYGPTLSWTEASPSRDRRRKRRRWVCRK